MRQSLIGIIAAAALVFAAQATAKTQGDAQKVKLPADPLAAVTAHQGWLNTSRPLVADDLRNRVVLLDFWTYCCINCIQIIPKIVQLEKQFGSDLTVIGVHSAKFKNEADDENIRQAIIRNGIKHPVVNDYDFSTWKAFQVHAWPTLVLINPQGGIESVYSGEGHFDELTEDIERLSKHDKAKIRHDALPLKVEASSYSLLTYPGKVTYTDNYKGQAALVVADTGHNRVVVTSLAGTVLDMIGNGNAGSVDGGFEVARFNAPQGVLFKDGLIYVADTGNHLLRLVNIVKHTVTTIAGNGVKGSYYTAKDVPALRVSLASPWDVAFWPDGRHVVVAMAGLHQVWSYDVEHQTMGVLAGTGEEGLQDGPADSAHLAQPSGLSPLGEKLYFVDAETSSLRVLEKGKVKTLIGTGLFDFGYKAGGKNKALMQHPLGVAASDRGIFIADSYNHAIRFYNTDKAVLEDYAGTGVRGTANGAAEAAMFSEPGGLAIHGGKLYVADTNNKGLRVIDLKQKEVSVLAVQEGATKDEPMLAEQLPNTIESESVKLALNAPITLTLGLKKGWHINKDAPSSLALFDLVQGNKAVVTYDREALEKNMMQIPPRKGFMYRLQGTFYYCEDKAGALCLVKSVDVPVSFETGGQADYRIEIN